MGQLTQLDDLKLGTTKTKRGTPRYKNNPSVPITGNISRKRLARIGDERKGFVFSGDTGEVLGPGIGISYEFEEVDSTRFVKLFLDGVKKAAGLSKAGLAVFEAVYQQMRSNPGIDEIKLSPDFLPESGGKTLARSTYFRGLRELLEREFLYRSVFDGVYFVNIRYMFNGDRLAFVKAYHLKAPTYQSEQPELPLAPPEPALPAPGA